MSRFSQKNSSVTPFQGDVLVRRRVGEAGDQPEPRLADPRANTVDKGQLPDRRVDRPLINQLLHLVQDRLALLVVEFYSLLLVELVEIGVAPINKNSALDDMGFKARRGVAERPGAGLNDVFERLFGKTFDEGGPFDRPKFWPDADCLEIIENRLPNVRVRGVPIIVAGVEASWVARLGEQLFGLVRVVDRSRRLPEELVMVWNDRVAGDQRIAEGQCLVRALTVDRQTGGPPHALVVPGRFRIPLV